MTENEIELFEIIRENDNPGKALVAAVVIALGFLKQNEEFSNKVAADPRVFS
jgi:hypothetical protein